MRTALFVMVTIHTKPEAPLEPAVETTLSALFADYRDLYVNSAFTAGLSGSHVVRVRGVQPDGSAELSAVAKVDQAARIEQEWHAYQSCVVRRLPGLAMIHAAPTFVDHNGERWGGLWYPLVGDDTFDVESLLAFLQTADSAEACALLEGQLFRQMDALWRQSDMRVEVSLGGTYDDVLPPNAVVRPLPVAAGSLSAIDLTPTKARAHRLTSAEIVSLRGFRVARLWPQQQRVLLDGAGDSAERYRLLLTDVADLDAFRVGERLSEPLVGVVVETRQQTLVAQVAQAIDTRVEISAERVTTPSKAIALPNPLHALPTLLGRTLANARFGCIHGDLNLENVLITRQTRSVHLIDFVNARHDHVIRDLVHLEFALVTHLLPLALASAELPPDAVVDFYERLHCAERMPDRVTPPAGLEKPFALLTTLRQTARAYLAELGNWDEYYAGLCVYLIGGLRYTSLDAVAGAKEVAFWASAEVLKLLDAKPDCGQMTAVNKARISEPESTALPPSAPSTQTFFHDQVTGPVHTGSGNIIINYTSFSQMQVPSESPSQSLGLLTTLGLDNTLPLASISPKHPHFRRLEDLLLRLRDNLARTLQQGNSPLREADRQEIFYQIDELLASQFGLSGLEAINASAPTRPRLTVHLSPTDASAHQRLVTFILTHIDPSEDVVLQWTGIDLGREPQAFEAASNQLFSLMQVGLDSAEGSAQSPLIHVYQQGRWSGALRLPTPTNDSASPTCIFRLDAPIELADLLKSNLSKQALFDLCQFFSPSDGSLAVATKAELADTLVQTAHQQDRLHELLRVLTDQFPQATWWETLPILENEEGR